ncbi:AAA family ATPase [Williamsia muralis]|uniref:AAA family ATPase n=1 Tax=Williamsia marianensis TaxID=85044 RepID=A0ABU4EW49_WILMA|nr:AAA family ATPase [Williamsia muralis]MDV7135483.1 AAA family ATPase [Williamsia muralis]
MSIDYLEWLERVEFVFNDDDIDVVGLVPASVAPFDPLNPATWNAGQLNDYRAYLDGTAPRPTWAGADVADGLEFGITVPTHANDGQRDAIEKFVARLYDAEKLRHLPRLEPLVDGWLWRGTVARLYAPPGSMKTFLSLDWAVHIALGRRWHGNEVHQGNVLFLAGEGARGLRDRREALERRYNDGNDIPGLYIDDLTFNLAEQGSDYAYALGTVAKQLEAVLIVVDTQSRYTTGADENSARELGVLVDMVDQLVRFTGATVLLVHHVARGTEHGRGSTVVEGAMQSEFFLNKTDKGGETRLTLRTPKQKDSTELSMALRPEPVGDSLVLVADDEPVTAIEGLPDGNGGVYRPDLMQQLSEHLRAEGAEMTRTALVDRVTGRKANKLAAVELLIRNGYFVNDPVSNRLTHAEAYTVERGEQYADRLLALNGDGEAS